MIIRYPLIHPAFDLPQGQTAKLIEELIKMKHKGENEGGDEILALADLIMHEERLPEANYIPAEGGAVHNLTFEFLRFLCSFRSVKHLLLADFGKRKGWNEIPLHICGIGSATAAIAASLIANDITDGEVITTSLNFVGVPNAIVLAGATPKFADINPDNLCMDMASLKKTISKKTKAIILVHFNQVVDLAPIDELYTEKGLDIPLIQDASLAIGSTCQGMPAGLVNLGKCGTTVYSFATSKILSGLGGAAVISHDLPLIERIRSIAYQGQNFRDTEEISNFGANFKMNDLNAVLVSEQLKKRKSIFDKRRHLKSLYDEQLADLVKEDKIEIQKVSEESIVTHYGILVPDRKSFSQRMSMRGIQIGLWHTVHLQEIYQKQFKMKGGTLPVTESIANHIAFLPFHTKLNDEDISFICKSLKEII